MLKKAIIILSHRSQADRNIKLDSMLVRYNKTCLSLHSIELLDSSIRGRQQLEDIWKKPFIDLIWSGYFLLTTDINGLYTCFLFFRSQLIKQAFWWSFLNTFMKIRTFMTTRYIYKFKTIPFVPYFISIFASLLIFDLNENKHKCHS